MEQLDATIVNTAVPGHGGEPARTPLSLKAVVTSYILSLAVCIPVSGWMADRFGTRRVFVTAVAMFTCASHAVRAVAERADAGRGAHAAGHRRRDDDAGRAARHHPHLPKSELLRRDELRHHSGADRAAARADGRRPDRALAVVARDLLRQRAGGPGRAVPRSRRYMPDYHGAEPRPLDVVGLRPVRLGHRAAVVAARNFRRAHARPDHSGADAVACRRPARGLCLACARSASSRCCGSRCSGAHVPRLGARRLRHPAGHRRHAVPAAAALPAGLGLPAWQSGLLMMPAAAAAMGMKLIATALLARFGYRAGADRQHGADRHDDRPVLAGRPATPVARDRLLGLAAGLLQLAAVLEHELAGLCRHRAARFEHGQHDRQLAAAAVDELRPGGRLAGHGLVPRRVPQTDQVMVTAPCTTPSSRWR